MELPAVKGTLRPWKIAFTATDKHAADRHFVRDLQALLSRVHEIVTLGAGVRAWIQACPDSATHHVEVHFEGYLNGLGAMKIEASVKLVDKVRE